MDARARTKRPINAFTGREYVAYQWRPVPAGYEDEAERNPYLEVRDAEAEAETEYPIHRGGGWYELPDGTKVQGANEALAAMEELDAN